MKTRRVCGIAMAVVLIAVTSVRAERPPTVHFPDGQTEVTIRLTRAGTMFLVPVEINGEHVGLFMVDTGATSTVIDPAVVQQLELPPIGRQSVRAVGGQMNLNLHAAKNISLGGASIHKTFVHAGDLTTFHRDVGVWGLAGVLGMDFLSRMPFKFDPREATLTLYHPETFTAPTDAQRHELVMIAGMPAISVMLEDRLFAWFILDLGSSPALSVGARFSRANAPWLIDRPWTMVTFTGAAGRRDVRVVQIEAIEYFGTREHDVSLSYTLQEEGAAHSLGAGAIGTQLLGSWEMTFDCRGGAIWVKRCPSMIPAEWDAPGFDAREADAAGITPLMRAAELGAVEYMKRFLATGVDPNEKAPSDSTALHYAVVEGHEEAVGLLIQAKADLDAKARGDQTPLHQAAREGRRAIVNQLIAAGAGLEVQDVRESTPLVVASEHGHAEIVADLLAAGAKLDHASEVVGSALSAAAYRKRAEIVKLLLDAGADARSVASSHRVPLIVIAARGGSSEVVRLLIEHGADVNATTRGNQTALMAAARDGYPDIVEMLLKAGARADHRDEEGHTALDFAVAGGDRHCITLLYYRDEDKPDEPVGGR